LHAARTDNNVEQFIADESTLRVAAFVAIFAAIAVWEAVAPRRPRRFRRVERWPQNLALPAINNLLLMLLVPGAEVGAAIAAQAHDWGLLPALGLPAWAQLAAAIVLLDLAIYVQHVVFHAVPMLWRVHRVHHADTDFDVTTGVRFHPLEIAISTAFKCAVIGAIGATPPAVIAFEILLTASSMFEHANARIPLSLDRWLRRIVVTPDMHRIHHSSVVEETNSNYGFNIAWWDRLFGTYRAQPAGGHTGMQIGLEIFRDAGEVRLDRVLAQPFRSAQAQASTTAEPPASP
jgi:sterol desaturase/sphingolipid hydroxylase (fatty acid hydroxylase superfamily)